MQLLNQFKFYYNGLYIKKIDSLIISDLHIGLESELKRSGLHLPLNEEKLLTDIIEKLFQKITPKNIILNGDILHSFSTLNYEIKQEFMRIIELLKKRSTRIYFIKGSHDTFIEKLVEPINFRSKSFIDEDILITHGNYSIDISKEINTIIIGHEHPCVEINLEKIPCFLFKHHFDRILNKFINYIILPSFNPLIEGVLINDQEFISPMLKDLNPNDFQPIINLEDETLIFPDIESLKNIQWEL